MAGFYTAVVALTYITFVIGAGSTLLRFYTRAFLSRKWGLDDYGAIGVLLGNIGQLCVLQTMLNLKCGVSMAESCSFASNAWLEVILAEETVLFTLHAILKLTVLCFYLRLSPSKQFRQFVFIGMGINAALYIGSILLAFLQCPDFNGLVDPLGHPEAASQCLDTKAVMITPLVVNIVCMDMYVLILPIPTIFRLNMSNRRKWAIVGIICCGACSIIITLVRIPVAMEMNESPDTSYVTGKMIIYVSIEVQLATVANNLPALAGLKWLLQQRTQVEVSGRHSSGNAKNGLSSLGRKKGRNNTPAHELGTVTKLERGITTNESEERLFTTTSRQGRPTGQGRPNEQEVDYKQGVQQKVATDFDATSVSTDGV